MRTSCWLPTSATSVRNITHSIDTHSKYSMSYVLSQILTRIETQTQWNVIQLTYMFIKQVVNKIKRLSYYFLDAGSCTCTLVLTHIVASVKILKSRCRRFEFHARKPTKQVNGLTRIYWTFRRCGEDSQTRRSFVVRIAWCPEFFSWSKASGQKIFVNEESHSCNKLYDWLNSIRFNMVVWLLSDQSQNPFNKVTTLCLFWPKHVMTYN